MKALVGVDGSSNSLAAVDYVRRLLSAEQDELILLYAVPEIPLGDEERLDPGVEERARASLSRAVFEEALARLPDAWQSRAERLEVHGVPASSLLAEADARAVDLIVVGFHGTSLLERIFSGSVSRAVVHSAVVPVLVVKAPLATGSRNRAADGGGELLAQVDHPLRVLVAYDGTQVGQRIAALLHRLTWPADAEGWLMTVVEPMFAAELPPWLQEKTHDADVDAMAAAWQREHEQSVAQARGELVQFARTLPACFAGRPPIVAEGRPAEQLLAKLSQERFELAVIGSRGRGSVARMLLGSTSDQVLTQSPCSVLIVR